MEFTEELGFVRHRGALALKGAAINALAAKYRPLLPADADDNAQLQRDGESYHITIASAAEFKRAQVEIEELNNTLLNDLSLFDVGIGNVDKHCYYVIVSCTNE